MTQKNYVPRALALAYNLVLVPRPSSRRRFGGPKETCGPWDIRKGLCRTAWPFLPLPVKKKLDASKIKWFSNSSGWMRESREALDHIYPYKLIRLYRTCGGGTAILQVEQWGQQKRGKRTVGSTTPSQTGILSWLVKCATVVVVNGNGGDGTALCIRCFHVSAQTRNHKSYYFLLLSPSLYLLAVANPQPATVTDTDTGTWNEYQHGGCCVQHSQPPIHLPVRLFHSL